MLNLSVGQPGGNGPLHQEFHLDEVLADLGGADCGDKTEIRSRRFVLQRVFGRGGLSLDISMNPKDFRKTFIVACAV